MIDVRALQTPINCVFNPSVRLFIYLEAMLVEKSFPLKLETRN